MSKYLGTGYCFNLINYAPSEKRATKIRRL